MRITEALQRFRAEIRSRLPGAAGRKGLAALGVAAMLGAAPVAQAQIQNGGFETGNFSNWTLRDYNRSNTTIPVTSSAQLGLTATGAVSNGGDGTGFRSTVLTSAGTAPNTNSNLKYPFSGNASARLGDSGGFKATSMEQVATMSLADVDPIDNKVHIRFAMAPVLNNPGHVASQQPFFFVEVINQTKGTTLFTTFNYSNQPGIPWQSVGAYQYTDWQGFDISPGNGLLDVGDQVLLKVYVSNCAAGAATHTSQVYVDVFGSRMPGLSVSATGPSTTKPGQQITYTYNYINNSGVLAVGSRVRLAAPITENGLHLAFVPGSWPPGCTGPFAGTAPRADYIDCPVGDLNDGAGGNFNVTFTVPAGAATAAPNNIVNNGDYDIRANTVSPFIGPLVKTTILPAATPTVDLGITVNNGGVSSYAVGDAVAYTVAVTNNGPIDVVGAVITQTLSGVTGTASWTCAPAPASTATCGAASGSGAISTTGNLPVGQSLVYTVTGITAATAGTSVVTVVNVAPPGGTSDSVSANNTDGVSTPVSASQNTLTVNTAGAGTGKVTATPATLACPSPGGAPCSSQLLGNGQEAYLNAVADPGSIFKNWTGDCTTTTGSQCYVKMGTTDLSVTAVFAKVWTVTPSIAGGTITPNSPQTVEDGQGAGFTITPGAPGQVPVITTPGGANTCPGILSGPVGGNYTWSVSPVTADCAFHVTFLMPDPKVEVVKSVTSAGPYTTGSVIDYQFVVTNTGNVALTGIVVNDAQLDAAAVCPVTTLAPSASTTCTGSHTVAAAEVAAGYVHNSATATGTPPSGPNVTSLPSAVDTPTAQNPAMTVVKSVTSTGPYTTGSVIAYQFVVTNSGDVNLTGIVVNDAHLDAPAVCPVTTLAPGASTTCTGSHTVTAAEVAAGYVHNSATVTGQPPTPPGGPVPPQVTSIPSTVDTATAQYPEMRILKSVTSSGPYAAGSLIAYRFDVTNTGSVTLDGITVNDARLDAPATCPLSSLAPGLSMTCTGSYTVTAVDVAAGYVQNTATVTGQPPTVPGGPTPPPVTSPPSTVTTSTAQNPGLALVKSVTSTGPYTTGNVIAYQFVVTNTGDVTLTGLVVNDAQLDAPAVCPASTLAPAATMTCTGSYTVTVADVASGNVHNSATASGQPPTVPGGTTPTPVTSVPSTVDTPTAQNPALTIVKSVTSAGPYTAGSVIAYQFVVTNAGDVTLSDVVVHDALLNAPATCPTTTLAPAATMTCTGSYTVTAADVEKGSVHNIATVSAAPPTVPGGPAPTPVTSAPGEVETAISQRPAIATAKTATLTVDNGTPGMANIGDVITYAVTVTNTGDVTLTGVAVQDTLDGYAPTMLTCAPATLAPGQTGTCATYSHTVTVADAGRIGGNLDNKVVATASAGIGGSFSVTALGNAMVLVEPDPVQLRVIKTAAPRDVKVGDLVRYTLSIQNTGTTPMVGGTIVDTPPAGFSYVDGSLAVNDADKAGQLAGLRPIVIERIDVPAGQTASVTYLLRVGAGVRTGIHTNSMLVRHRGQTVSNVATADVQLVGDPTLDESLVVGTVFDDQNGNGLQESGERGIPGVRIASVEGVLAETDQFGRYHLTGIDGGRWERGRNFILKVDPATLPPGTTFSTDNPLLRRVTPGLPVRFDFGVKLPEGRIGGGAKVVELELGEVLFAPESAALREAYLPVIDAMAVQIREHGAGEVMIAANSAGEVLALDRAKAVRDALLAKLDPALAKALTVSLRTDLADPNSTLLSLGESPVLGTVLFDTDKAAIKPEYTPVIAKIAADIEALGGGVVGVTGHADRRGSDAYNAALGLRRAKAVYEAIAARLGAEARSRLRVEINDNPAAPVGLQSR